MTEHLPRAYQNANPVPGEEVVVSGIAGTFPESENIQVLQENLFNKVDLITCDGRRWKINDPEFPRHIGKVKTINEFDADFFDIPVHEAVSMDPMARIVLEKAFESIIDAGVNPKELYGTRTGVFVGDSSCEAEKCFVYSNPNTTGLAIPGCMRSMQANRISSIFNLRGPSYAVNTACSSSLYALEQAYCAIREGICDAAIVGGCNLCLHPNVALSFFRLGVLSRVGKSQSFDKDGDGYARSETIVVIFLQKAKDARRCYLQIKHGKTNADGFKQEGFAYPNGHLQKQLLKECYTESCLDLNEVEYIEAHGTGTKVGDPEELQAIAEVFGGERDRPLLIGSVKSNLGHSEIASGLNSLVKMCIAYNTGFIPPNLHFKEPVSQLIRDDKFIVVTEKMPWNKGYAGISSFGVGGANAHIITNNIAKPKVNNGAPTDNLPRLVCVSGRTVAAVRCILDDLLSRPVDVEYIALLRSIFELGIDKHDYRGYLLLEHTPTKSIALADSTNTLMRTKRQFWLIFDGILSNKWSNTLHHLVYLPAFAASIKKCEAVLSTLGINFNELLKNSTQVTENNILHTLIGSVVVQIGICDLMKTVGVNPDRFYGLGPGVICATYMQGLHTMKQTLVAAYYLGKVLEHINTMVCTVKLATSYVQIRHMLPSGINITCNSGSNSCTLIGSGEKMRDIIPQFIKSQINIQEISYLPMPIEQSHASRYEIQILEQMKQMIPKSLQETCCWIWSPLSALKKNKYDLLTLPEYLHIVISNIQPLSKQLEKIQDFSLVSLVSLTNGFDEGLKSILKWNCVTVPYTDLTQKEPLTNFLCYLGRLYNEGLNLQISNIYPEVQFPVSAGTPMLSPCVGWDHRLKFSSLSEEITCRRTDAENMITVTFDDEHEFMKGHVVDGRNLYPATGYLLLVWDSFTAMIREQSYTNVSVVMEDVRFIRATHIPTNGPLHFHIVIQKGTGYFEINEGGTSIVTGYIRRDDNLCNPHCKRLEAEEKDDKADMCLSKKDFYKELRLRGYNYSGLFRSIQKCNLDGTRAEVLWQNNWIAFLDNLLQVIIVNKDTRGLYVPTNINRISIDVTTHYEMIYSNKDQFMERLFNVYAYPDLQVIRSGGVEISGLNASPITKRSPLHVPVLEKYLFIPYFSDESMKVNHIIRVYIQIILENLPMSKINTLELIDDATRIDEPITPLVRCVLEDLPLIQPNTVVISTKPVELGEEIKVEDKKLSEYSNILLIIGTNLLERNEVQTQAFDTLCSQGYILSRETLRPDLEKYSKGTVQIISSTCTENEVLVLFRKRASPKPTVFVDISTPDNFTWIETVRNELKCKKRVVVISQDEQYSGLLGLINCLTKEYVHMISGLLICDPNALKFNREIPFYQQQIEKNLVINVYKNGMWGSYRHLLLDEPFTIKAKHAYINQTIPGDLSSLLWTEGALNKVEHVNTPNTQIIQIYYAALNFRDVMTATGRISVETVARDRLSQECVQGLEFCGRTDKGERVMGMATSGALANMITANVEFIWPVPKFWTLAEACTVPVAYSTVYYAFAQIGGLRPGQKVLIHAGTGGVGQAAIHICLHAGCEVFTTVGTPEKRKFLGKLFPKIPESHIGNSRDVSFKDMIMMETKGQGVDVVLNSLAEEKLQASLQCLGYGGKFLEIGKFDFQSNSLMGLNVFKKNISFHSIMMDSLMYRASKEQKKKLQTLIFKALKQGIIKPLTNVTFRAEDVEKAFRYMAGGKHIGKVLIKIRDEEQDWLVQPGYVIQNAMPRNVYDCDASHVIVGGLGGFGLELIDRMVIRGARKVVINSRRGICNGYQALRIKIWRSYGTEVFISTEDVTTEQGCINMLTQAKNMGPVQSIYNLAVVLLDALFENQTPENFEKSFCPKVLVTKNLDEYSRTLCPNLKEFVVFSSVSCGRGNTGQTNYGMANSIMERICEQRHNEGLPAIAIQWGAIGQVGLVADMQEEQRELEIGGTLQQNIFNCLDVMDIMLNQKHAIVASMVVAEKRTGLSGSENLAEIVASILGFKDLKKVSHQMSLVELGMDSMSAVEIKHKMEQDFEIFLSPQEIKTLNFARLLELSVQRQSGENIPLVQAVPTSNEMIKIMIGNIFEEDITRQEVVYLNSYGDQKLSNGSMENDDESVLFVIPGLEGVATMLKPIIGEIKMRACALQYGLDYNDGSVNDIAKRLFLKIERYLSAGSNFYLLGYSYGTLVATEIAHMLEQKGHKGIVFCLDGGPKFLKISIGIDMSQKGVLENIVISHIFSLVCSEDLQQKIKDIIVKLDTFEEKLDSTLELLPAEFNLSLPYVKCLIQVIFDRINSILYYDWMSLKKLKSQIVLIRALKSINMQSDDDYGLSECTELPVEVFVVQGDHVSIIDNNDCIQIINNFIDKKH